MLCEELIGMKSFVPNQDVVAESECLLVLNFIKYSKLQEPCPKMC